MSGYTLVTVAQRNGRTLICVQMDSDSWSTIYTDAKKLFDYGFAQPDTAVSSSASAAGSIYANIAGGTNTPKAAALVKKTQSGAAVVKLVLIAVAGLAVLALGVMVYFKIRDRRRFRPREINTD